MSQLPQLPPHATPPLDDRAGDASLPPLFARSWWLFFHLLRSFISDLSASVDTLSMLTGTAGTYTKVTTDARGLVTAGATADLSGSDVTGILAAARFPALTGDITTSAGAVATTLKATGTAGTYTKVTTDAQGRVTVGATANLSGTDVTGTLAAARFPALTGDITTSAGSIATALKNTGPGAGTYTVGLKLTAPGVNGTITIDAQGRITNIQQAT